ncbi:DNA-binding transcriptional activator of the SARP family [Kibdelosporangium sp. 4NS15]|uniref:DNA-binding transcriptional activator of the SARP family n=1 Tax=Kibdelosporangium persicum TaxID=2698649 RepID=A0ABX2FIV3_9PSEU|nr:DNA-binding transcriptional activator of the SARP family [Kibdelosporangium persicum]
MRSADSVVQVGGPRMRALLAALVLRANQPVPVKHLVNAAWEGDTPLTSAATVHSYVCRLRARLASAGPDGENRILTDATGYRLRVEPGESDVELFRERIDRSHTLLNDSCPADAGTELSAALALWRGPALTDVPGRFAQLEAVSLNEARLAAQQESMEIDLSFGRHTQVIPELQAMFLRYPQRERLAALLMRALYRGGQQAEALQVYRTARQALVEELAIEPGPELKAVHQKILNHDVELAFPAATPGAGRHSLPPDTGTFVGRALEVRRIVTAATARPHDGRALGIAAIDGMAGVGKTRLAVHVSHQLADRFPDGQLFVDLHGHTDGRAQKEPSAALAELLEAVGVPAGSIPVTLEQRIAVWRTQLANRKVLLVLDNAASAAQVTPLLTGGSGCFVLITSRNRLIGSQTTETLSLKRLAGPEAGAFFEAMLADRRAAAESGAVAELTEMCGGLPLALQFAAARLRHRPTWTIADLVAQLHRDRLLMADLDIGKNGLAAAFDTSFACLNTEQQRVFRAVSRYRRNTFTVTAVAAATGLSSLDAERMLESLVDVNMIEPLTFGQYQIHDLLRAYGQRAVRFHSGEPPAAVAVE